MGPGRRLRQSDRPGPSRYRALVDDPRVYDIVGGTWIEPGDTELDDTIEQIVGDYVPDSLVRVQLAKRILAEVLRRTPINDPYARRLR